MKISIVTISWNAAKTIEQTICSIIGQKTKDTEYIIIDGGSTDETLDIVEKYKDKIDCLISEKDRGISDAFNKGINKATGDVIGIINADDLLLNGALEHVFETMKEETDVFYGRVASFTTVEKVPMVYRIENYRKIDISKLRYEMVISHPATFIRKSAYQKYGQYDLTYRNSMDRELLLRMYLGGAHFQETPYALSMFRTGGTTDNSFKRSIDESYQITRKYGGNRILAEYTRMKKLLYFETHREREKA